MYYPYGIHHEKKSPDNELNPQNPIIIRLLQRSSGAAGTS
jgi:hypothetical protein